MIAQDVFTLCQNVTKPSLIHPSSAAIYGLRGKQDISIFILYPWGRVSPIQEAQMATVPDENVHCVAVDGTFDDCQVR